MEKPSFLTSTFSVITFIVVVGYTGLCIYLKDLINLKEVVLMLLGGYGFKKGMEIANAPTKSKPEEKPNGLDQGSPTK